MTSYEDITRQIGDQWVATLKRAEDAVTAVSQNVQEATAKFDVPQVPVPDQVTQFNEAVAERLPKPSEILAANFELTERLLAAQKALALTVMEAATAATAPAAATASATASATATDNTPAPAAAKAQPKKRTSPAAKKAGR